MYAFLAFLPAFRSVPAWYSSLQQNNEFPEFTLQGKSMLAKITKVYDGDTVWASVPLCDEVYRFNFRLTGIDTPEIRSGVVRDFGKQVRDRLSELILYKIVRVQAGEADKYGRVLGTFFAYSDTGVEFNVNKFLVDNLMAKPYDGGTKDQFTASDEEAYKTVKPDIQYPTTIDYPLQKYEQL